MAHMHQEDELSEPLKRAEAYLEQYGKQQREVFPLKIVLLLFWREYHMASKGYGKMLTQKGIVSTSDSMCAEARDIMVKC